MTQERERPVNLGVAPGLNDHTDHSSWQKIQTYFLGLILSAILTIAAFYFVQSKSIWGPSIPVALAVLAVAQIGVHLAFFLHLTTGPDNVNNSLALAFGTLVVALVIGGTLWIMYNMNQNMPMMMHMASQSHGPNQHQEFSPAITKPVAAVVEASVAGRVRSISCDVGMRVTKGQICAVIEVPELDRERVRAEKLQIDVMARIQQEEIALSTALDKLNQTGAKSSRKSLEARKQITSIEQRLEKEKSSIQDLKKALEATNSKIEEAYVLAPFDGVVKSREIKLGDEVDPNSHKALFTFIYPVNQ
jgi:cytochrome o ubiquinol oxidase subunit IV